MVVINVDVPESVARKFASYKVVSSDILYDELDSNYDTLVDFGKEGVPVSEVLSYLKSK